MPNSTLGAHVLYKGLLDSHGVGGHDFILKSIFLLDLNQGLGALYLYNGKMHLVPSPLYQFVQSEAWGP